MRLLVEIFLIGALIYLGWEIPFKDRLPGSVVPQAPRATVTTQRIQPTAQARVLPTVAPRPVTASSPSGSWMFDPNHRSALDPPRHKSPTPH